MEKEKYKLLEKLFGRNFIGPNQLNIISAKMSLKSLTDNINDLPEVPSDIKTLETLNRDHILILGNPDTYDNKKLTINRMRAEFGIDPLVSEPSFYNQDWYIKETFANTCSLEYKWYLLKKTLVEESRGLMPVYYQESGTDIAHHLLKLPSALLIAYTFFVYYYHTRGEILWEHDYIWCEDKDHNGDQIYVGRYKDPMKVNKNGFSVHRFLSINKNYGCVFDIS